MYGVILALHNIIRWVVVIFGLFASGRALMGWIGKKEWTSVERKFGVFFTNHWKFIQYFFVPLY